MAHNEMKIVHRKMHPVCQNILDNGENAPIETSLSISTTVANNISMR